MGSLPPSVTCLGNQRRKMGDGFDLSTWQGLRMSTFTSDIHPAARILCRL